MRALIFLFLPILCYAGLEKLVPQVGSEFGEIVQIRAEFIEKPNTYYAQNIIKEKYLLKVLSVNEEALKDPKIMEYRWDTKDIQKVRIEKVYEFMAYEVIFSDGVPRGWDRDELMHQDNYRIISFIYIKPMTEPVAGTDATR